jgi:hypothetical protein
MKVMLHTFLIVAANRYARSDSRPGRFSPGERAVLYSLHRKLSGFQSLSGSLGRETMFLPLPGFESQFFGLPSCSVVSILIELPRVQTYIYITVKLYN